MMRIPKRYWNSKLAKVSDENVKRYVGKYVAEIHDMLDEGVGLLLSGYNGTGKTSIACYIGKRARMVGATVVFTTAAALMESLLDRDDEDIIHKAKSYDLLILDDLGKEHRGQSAWSENTLESLFRHRNGEKLSTIITTNLIVDVEGGKNLLREEYKTSLVETMREMCYPIYVSGENMRDESSSRISKIFEREEE